MNGGHLVYLEHVQQGLGKPDGVHGHGDAVGQGEHQALIHHIIIQLTENNTSLKLVAKKLEFIFALDRKEN